jgi:transposase-like protein
MIFHMVNHQGKPNYSDMSWMIFQEEFRSEDDCVDWLFRTRWPHDFECPKCGGKKYWQLKTRSIYKCASCRHQVSITAGTIFHKTRIPLLKWFMLIYRMSTSKTGVSINEMKRELEINDYKTIWVMAHKVRKAMADRDAQYKLAGLVEIDESFFGPKSNGKRGRGANNKQLVIVAVSTWTDRKGKEHPAFAHAFIAEDAKAETIEGILRRIGILDDEIEPLISSIRSDGWRSYQTASEKLDITHHRIVLRDPKDSMKILPWTHKVIANSKAVFAGPHRGVSKKHLQSYLSEVCYRFNRCFWGRQAFHRLLFACASTTALTRDQLMAEKKGELSQ